MATPTSPTLPNRSSTGDESVSGTGEDTSEATKLFQERLQAWKHACGYLEDYVSATEKLNREHVKEYDKVFKVINQPLREQNHFSQQHGGISTMFDSIRGNTTAISNSYGETAKNLHDVVLPIFQKLHQEVKDKTKDMTKSIGKATKNVDKARASSQSHIELLGSNTATHGIPGHKPDPSKDPYVIQKGVYYRLHKQIQEENGTRQDMLAFQDSFSQFEIHVIDTFQQGLNQFYNAVAGQSDRVKALYGGMIETADNVDPLFEWNGFLSRNDTILIDKMAPPRSMSNITFPNQDHPSTKPLIQGTLERKSGMLKKKDSSFYVVTPSKFLHQFSNEDNTSKDPSPELSLYLPDCVLGPQVAGDTFAIKGKDQSKGKLGTAMSRETEYSLKAPNAGDAETWFNVIKQVTGSQSGPIVASPTSPVASPTSPQDAEKKEQVPPIDTSEHSTAPPSYAGPSSAVEPSSATTGTPDTANVASTDHAATPASAGAATTHPAAGGGTTTTSPPTAAATSPVPASSTPASPEDTRQVLTE